MHIRRHCKGKFLLVHVQNWCFDVVVHLSSGSDEDSGVGDGSVVDSAGSLDWVGTVTYGFEILPVDLD